MLEKLQKQIQQKNKETEKTIDEVARRQNYLTLFVILFNIVIYFLLNTFLGDKEPLIPPFDNSVINFIISLSLIAVSFPLASKFVKKNLTELKLSEEQVDPEMNYAGIWEYETIFTVESPSDGSESYALLLANFNGFKEKGLSKWTQNVFELKINFAYTDPTQFPEVADEPARPTVIWESNPISFDENKINWSFSGEILWKEKQFYANKFSGIESYMVQKRDEQHRPSYLAGRLIGTVLVGDSFYVVSAESSFTRK